jgi:2-polyprenyl-6-methoxyphenol hydroxylase-like FAD-dependent oxidoreductase
MSPFGGEGANLAMLDGAELALFLASESAIDALDGAIIRYEQEMFARGNTAATESDLNMREFISEDGLKRGLAHIRREIGKHAGPPVE